MSFQKGFTTLELIFSIFVFSVCITLVSQSLIYLKLNQVIIKTHENIIALEQLKITLALANKIEVDYDRLYYRYKDEDFECYFSEDRLIVTPGTVIYLTEVEEGHFEVNDQLVSIHFIQEGREVNEIVCKLS